VQVSADLIGFGVSRRFGYRLTEPPFWRTASLEVFKIAG
jgi:hypothetical protein